MLSPAPADSRGRPYVSRHHFGGVGDVLARAKICHDTLVDLTREEACETPDDLASRAAVSGASCDVLDGARRPRSTP